jgi:hypothetical protein
VYLNLTSRPLATFPATGTSGVGSSTSLKWNKSLNASSYRVELSTLSDFSTLVLSDTAVSDTTRSISGLTANLTYYWRVAAVGAQSTSRYSAVSTFSTSAGDSTLLADNSTDSTVIVVNPKKGRKKTLASKYTFASASSNPSLVKAEDYQPATTSVSLHPNPATTTLMVRLPAEAIVLRLHSISGETVLETIPSSGDRTELDVSQLPAGTYFLSVHSNEGSTTHRVVVQR